MIHSSTLLDNPEENLTPYREENLTPYRHNAKALLAHRPSINWKPAQRSGKLALLLIPWGYPFALIPFLTPSALVATMFISWCVGVMATIITSIESSYGETKMAVALRGAWWPITLVVIMVKAQCWMWPLRPFLYAYHYIMTGE